MQTATITATSPPNARNDNAPGGTEASVAIHEHKRRLDFTARTAAQEAFHRGKLAYDFYIRNGGTAREIDDALAGLNRARAELLRIGEIA